ncbi:MAG: class I SAM-dependent methyltransferase [Patescibacteria group bacterium]
MSYRKILICPTCKVSLIDHLDYLLCQQCGTQYRFEDGILNALPKTKDSFVGTEEKFWDYTYEQEGERPLNDRSSYFHEHFRKPLRDLPSGATIVELGCGTRADILEMADSDRQIIATDISLRALQFARTLAQKMNVSSNVEFIRAAAHMLPFGDSTVDGVLMAAAFHHIESPDAGIKEMNRIVKNGGYIVLGVEPNSWPYKTIYRALSPIKKYVRKKRNRGVDSVADDKTKGFSKKDFITLFTKYNIEIVEIKPVKYSLEWYDSYLRFRSRLTGKKILPSRKLQDRFTGIDNVIEKIPVINFFNWHWNVIGRVRK